MNLIVNGREIEIRTEADRPLLWALRDELGLTGTKFGCGAGYCGVCTVQMDGEAVRSCITPVSAAAGKSIRTVEGLATANAAGELQLHPIQQAFLDNQVPQCSWCMSGQMMTALAFLEKNPAPAESEIVDAMANNYCRCGCYVRIKSAVSQAALEMRRTA